MTGVILKYHLKTKRYCLKIGLDINFTLRFLKFTIINRGMNTLKNQLKKHLAYFFVIYPSL